MRIQDILDTIPDDLDQDHMMNLLGGLKDFMIEQVRSSLADIDEQTQNLQSHNHGLLDVCIEYLIQQLGEFKINRLEASALLGDLMPWWKMAASLDEANVLITKAVANPEGGGMMLQGALGRTMQAQSDINSLTTAQQDAAFQERHDATVHEYMEYIRHTLGLEPPAAELGDGDEA